jgi:hypothetical protein
MEINVVLANEGILKSGEYLANIAVIGGDGCVWSKSVKFCLDENELAVPVYNGEIEVRLPKGRYTLVAELDEGAARGAELDFEIKDRNDNRVDGAFVYTAGLSRESVEHLENFGVSCAEWSGECDGAVLVGMVDAKTASKAIDAANNGASVFFLDVQTFFDSNEGGIDAAKAVISDLKRCYYHDWLYHKECAFNDSEMFKGFNNGLARLRDFENVFPSHVFKTDVTPDYPLCPAFQTGYFAVKDAYMLAYAMLGHNFGRGKVFFSSFEILKYLGTPTADRLLSNIVRYVTK